MVSRALFDHFSAKYVTVFLTQSQPLALKRELKHVPVLTVK